MPKEGDERTGFLGALRMFGWVPLARGCASSMLVYPGCVSVLLHGLLHAFSRVCLLPRCYTILLVRCYMHGSFLKNTVQVILVE